MQRESPLMVRVFTAAQSCMHAGDIEHAFLIKLAFLCTVFLHGRNTVQYSSAIHQAPHLASSLQSIRHSREKQRSRSHLVVPVRTRANGKAWARTLFTMPSLHNLLNVSRLPNRDPQIHIPSAHAPRVSSHGATRMYGKRGEGGDARGW